VKPKRYHPRVAYEKKVNKFCVCDKVTCTWNHCDPYIFWNTLFINLPSLIIRAVIILHCDMIQLYTLYVCCFNGLPQATCPDLAVIIDRFLPTLHATCLLKVYVNDSFCLLSWSRGKELDCRSMGRGFEPWPMSGPHVITHRSCPDDRLAQFNLAIVHKGGLK
jgi:hypothetical protein